MFSHIVSNGLRESALSADRLTMELGPKELMNFVDLRRLLNCIPRSRVLLHTTLHK
jgi:hypothetical protein